MPRRWLPVGVLSALTLGMIVMCSAQETKTPPQANAGPAEAKAEDVPGLQLSDAKAPTREDLRKALGTPVPVDFEDDPLVDVMKILAKGIAANILVDEQALQEEGVALDEGVTMKSKPIAAARALDRMLEPLGLTWVIEDHVVKITTIVAADEKLYTVTYPVGDLLKYAEEHQSDDLAKNESRCLTYVSIPFPDGSGCLGSSDSLASWLIDLLQNMTPGPWEDIDGTGGSISFVKNSLSIRQTQRNHEQVEKMLSTVRDFTKGELKPKAVPIRPPHYAVDEDEVVKQSLDKVVSMKARDVPLKEFIEDLGKKLDVPVYIDLQALTEEGVAVDEPLNFDLKNLPADSLLRNTFEPLGLSHLVDDGQLFVTTIVAAEERLVTIIHDVRDLDEGEYSGTALVDLLENETSGPWENIDGTGGGVLMPLNGLMAIRQTQKVHHEVAAILSDLRKQLAASEAKIEKKEPPDPQTVSTKFYALDGASDMQAIQQAVITLVEPKSWSKNGGEGEIFLINNLLVVKAKNEIQTKVQAFLKDLEKANAAINPPFSGGSFGGGMGGGGGGGGFFQLPPGEQNPI